MNARTPLAGLLSAFCCVTAASLAAADPPAVAAAASTSTAAVSVAAPPTSTAPPLAATPGAAPPPAAPPPAAPAPVLTQPVAPAATQTVPPAPTPMAATQLPVTPAPAVATGVASELPYYTPSAGEVYVAPFLPPPPKRPARPGLKIELGAYYQFQSLVGGYAASGFISEVGAGIGFTRLRILLGYIPNNRLAVLGLQLPNLTGWKLATFGEAATLSILAPNAQIKAVTNFRGDFYGSLGANAIGVAFVSCAGFPISVKVRGPSFSLWVPFTSQGQSIPNTRVMYGYGAGFDVGIPLF